MNDMIPANPGFYVVELELNQSEEVKMRRLPIIGWSKSRDRVEPCTIPDWEYEFRFIHYAKNGVEYSTDYEGGGCVCVVTAVGILEPGGSVSTVTPEYRDEEFESVYFENIAEWTAFLIRDLVEWVREDDPRSNAA